MAVFTIIYFCIWKGVKTSGKVLISYHMLKQLQVVIRIDRYSFDKLIQLG